MYGVVRDRSKLEQLLVSDVPWLNSAERAEIVNVYFGQTYYPSWPEIYGPQFEDELEPGCFPDYQVSYNVGSIMVRNLTDIGPYGPFYGLTTDEVWNPEV